MVNSELYCAVLQLLLCLGASLHADFPLLCLGSFFCMPRICSIEHVTVFGLIAQNGRTLKYMAETPLPDHLQKAVKRDTGILLPNCWLR